MMFRAGLIAVVTGTWGLTLLAAELLGAEPQPWPPALPGAVQGTVTFSAPSLLEIPAAVKETAEKPEAAPFVVAKSAPRVALAFHGNLGDQAAARRLWSSWGDICVARDGRVYSGIGDHGDDVGGDARCFLYRWDPAKKVLEQVVDVNTIVTHEPGQPAWSKMHAKIDEGPGGVILFSGTLNDGNRAKLPTHRWSDTLPGGQLYQYDPATNQSSVVTSLPPRRCTATSLVDRDVWWCNLEAGEGNALWGFDLVKRKVVFQGPDGSVVFNRCFAVTRDGTLLFNGAEGLERLDPRKKKITPTGIKFGDTPGMRCATRESRDGYIYGVTHKTNQLFRYHVGRDEWKLLGPAWLVSSYTTVAELSPDERFVYYLPGAHGGAFKDGTPIVQYEIATGQRKVLAFLAPTCEERLNYVPAGTYGMKLNAAGDTIFVNFNGHATESYRPAHRRADGFGLCAFAAIEIPASER